MNKRVICISSSLENGALTEPQSFFEKTVEAKSSALPTIGSIVPPACIAPKNWKRYGLRQGRVTDATKIENGMQRVCMVFPILHEFLRDCLEEEGGYKEVPGSPK